MVCRILTLFLLAFSTLIKGQDVQINNIIATDIVATDDDILVIQFNDQLPNLPFIVAWMSEDGKQYALQLLTTEDDLKLSLSLQQGWSGNIQLLGLSINNVDATIRKTSLSDRWDLFLNPFPLSPGTINFSPEYIIYGTAFRWICLGLMGFLWLLIFIKNRKLGVSLLFSFVVAWSVYDLRSMKTRWDIMNTLSDQEYQIEILKDLDVFLLQARDIIADGSWTKEQLSGFLNSYCTYQLADLPYKPANSDVLKEADFIITTQPNNRRILLNNGPYFLIEANRNQ